MVYQFGMEKKERKRAKGPDVYAMIRHGITSGRYIPGQRLSERELAARYGVSRTPIREAFRPLIQEGLVAYEPHCGYRIMPLSEERARQIMVVREFLEGLAARLAAARDGQGTARELRKTLQEARRAYSGGQLSDLISANQGFHRILVEKSGNAVLEHLYRTLQGYIGLMMSVSLSWPRRPTQTIREHEDILRALKTGSPEISERAVRRHVRNAYKGVLRNVKRYLDQEG